MVTIMAMMLIWLILMMTMVITLSKECYLVEGHQNKQLNVDDDYDNDRDGLVQRGFSIEAGDDNDYVCDEDNDDDDN